MPKKNNISGLKLESKNTLLSVKAQKAHNKPWPKPKSIDEKQSELVALKMTKGQIAIIEKKRWLVPKATYLMDKLINQTDVFR